MKKLYIVLLIGLFGIIVIMNSLSALQFNEETNSDEPYYCYIGSLYHCNSYKPFLSGEQCARYCEGKTRGGIGNKMDRTYNCMLKCVYGDLGGKTIFNKRLNGKTGLGLNYKF